MWMVIIRLLATELVFSVSVSEDEAEWFKIMAERHRNVCNTHESCESSGINHKSPCCATCTCDSSCEKYGSCCLGFYKNFTHARTTVERTRYNCIRPQYLSPEKTFFNTRLKFWMISKCSLDYTADAHTQHLCENPGTDDHLDSVIPVSDPIFNVHYRNVYCAYCNGVEDKSQLLSWKLEIQSLSYIALPDRNLLSQIRRTKGNILYVQPAYVHLESCNLPPYNISSCNVTGQWPEYDRNVETACHSFLDPFNITYKNYFCYLCNTDTHIPVENWTCIIVTLLPIKDITPTFFALLDLAVAKGDESRNKLLCDSNQFVDYKLAVCRDVVCHKDRYLKNGVCIERESVWQSACFGIFIKMTPLSDKEKLGATQLFDIEKALDEEVTLMGVPTEKIVLYDKENVNQVDFVVVFMMAELSSKDYQPNYLHTFVESVSMLNNKTIEVRSSNGVIWWFSTEITLYDITFFENHSVNILLDNTRILTYNPVFIDSDDNTCLKQGTTPLNRLFICPFIKIGMEEMSSRIENGVLKLRKGDAFREFSKWSYDIQDGHILICLEDYKIFYEAVTVNTTDKPPTEVSIHPKDILALICVSLSMVCLLLTIVTYVIFTSLQSQPGINNLILCIFLLFAQTIYQFGAGQRSLSYTACSIIGALCHLLWLCVMFSMTVCSINMFILFRWHIKISPKFSWTHTVRNALYVVCASMFFICINLFISLGKSGGADSGYGGNVCFISSNLMQLLTFIIPSAFTLVINVILFSYVIYRIEHISSSTVKLHKERNYLGIYARLSTLTGLTWIFGFLRVFFTVEALEYLFVIFNASQGVFIMIAFVMNMRIYHLCFAKNVYTSRNETKETVERNRD